VVWNGLVAERPTFGAYERAISVAVNAEYSRMSAVLADGDEVAFMPPVSGG
jgi:molybdopterin converting factor small subunit